MGHCDIEPGTLPATFVEELTVLQQPVLPVELNATLEPAADFAKAPTAPATRAAYGSGCRNRQHRQAAVDIPADEGLGSQALDEPTSARGLVAHHAFKHFLGTKNGIQ